MKDSYYVPDIIPRNTRYRLPMYIGDWSLKSLSLYFQAYTFALKRHDIKDSHYLEFFHFSEFVSHELGICARCVGWANIILAYSLGYRKDDDICWVELREREKTLSEKEHKKSIDIFFELFDKFYSFTFEEFYHYKLTKINPNFFCELESGDTFGIAFNIPITLSLDVIILQKYRDRYVVYQTREEVDFNDKDRYHLFDDIYQALHFIYLKVDYDLKTIQKIDEVKEFKPELIYI